MRDYIAHHTTMAKTHYAVRCSWDETRSHAGCEGNRLLWLGAQA